MADAAEERRWSISVRRRELQWDEFKRRLNKRRKFDLGLGLPAILGFALLNYAFHSELLARSFWTITGMFVLLGLFMAAQFWPQPELPHESEFNERATKQIDAELST